MPNFLPTAQMNNKVAKIELIKANFTRTIVIHL